MSDKKKLAAAICLNNSQNVLMLSCIVAASVAARTILESPASSNRLGHSARPRIRRAVEDVLEALGEIFFCRAYRMSYPSFLQLNIKLASGILLALDNKRHSNHQKNPSPIPNGEITTSVRLACAL